jgi:hypothetical protein
MLVYSDQVNFLADSWIGDRKTNFLPLAEKMVPVNLRSLFYNIPANIFIKNTEFGMTESFPSFQFSYLASRNNGISPQIISAPAGPGVVRSVLYCHDPDPGCCIAHCCGG